ncbi:O-methyltransferase [Penicillium waksmanii]|uniref:O-methyltransferase n=1 Tax=Penicillium waksmanii TaxID=69791 RepID=UPI002548C3E4|nr:O-methyltransferase [Penicillium waksmanii]KAJ5984735.1 O-methyltransferase [Penicillium waksmanii]
MTVTDKTDVQKLAVQKDVDEIINFAQRFMKAGGGDMAGDEVNLDLQKKAFNLFQTLRGPVSSALSSFENVNEHPLLGSLRTLLAAGVFHVIPQGGPPMTASVISSRTGMDKSVLIRLMRAVTPFGPFCETGEEEYAHTPYSEAYLTADIASCFPVMSDLIFGLVLQICDFLRQHDWKNAITTRSNPFTLAHKCPGRTMFEYLYKNPRHVAPVTKAEAADVDQMAMDLFSWEDRLSGVAKDHVTIVDIAGSHGNAMRQIREIAPGQSAVSRFFLVEWPCYGRDGSCYYFRRIFHDWPDLPEAKKILQNTTVAMDRDQSRVLIHDIIVPETGATMTHAWQDLSLMAIGGIESTEENFASILESIGLVLVKVWRKLGDIIGIVEARLQ